MAKQEIIFDVDALSKKDYAIYQKLEGKDAELFEKNWVALAKQKQKVKQAQARLNKAKSKVRKKEDKERTHHLIQVGAIVEKYVKITDLEKFDAYIKQYARAIQNSQPKIEEEVRKPDPDPVEEEDPTIGTEENPRRTVVAARVEEPEVQTPRRTYI